MVPIIDQERCRLALLEFARVLNREVCIRAANHPPHTAEEKRQKDDGVVEIHDLDCVKYALRGMV